MGYPESNQLFTKAQAERLIAVIAGVAEPEELYPETNELLTREQGERLIEAVRNAMSGGSGSGDMTKEVYDPDEVIADAGGIAAYVDEHGSDIIFIPFIHNSDDEDDEYITEVSQDYIIDNWRAGKTLIAKIDESDGYGTHYYRFINPRTILLTFEIVDIDFDNEYNGIRIDTLYYDDYSSAGEWIIKYRSFTRLWYNSDDEGKILKIVNGAPTWVEESNS